MNKKAQRITFISIVFIIVLGAVIFYVSQKNQLAEPVTNAEAVTSDTTGVSFRYPTGEDGFTLVTPPSEENGMLEAYIMMPTGEYEAFKVSEEPREAPAAMSVFVFALEDEPAATSGERADRITRLQNWAIDNSTLTSFNLAKNTPDIVEIDGLKALYYQADGLYQQDIYLASYRGNVYMFVSQYNDPADITYTAFQELITTISFD